MAGGSARGFGARVKTAADSRGSSARSIAGGVLVVEDRQHRDGALGHGLARARRCPGALCAPSKIVSGSWSTTCRRPGDRRATIAARRRSGRAEQRLGGRRGAPRGCAAGSRAASMRDWRRAGRSSRPVALGQRDAPRAASSPSTSVAPGAHDRELLARDVGDRRAEPARVLEPDVGEHDDRRRRARSSRRSGRRGPPRPPRPRRSRRASSSNAAAVSSSNWVTRSPSAEVRSTFAAAAAARWIAAPNSAPERSASPTRMRSANVVRCGDRYAPVRTPCASSSAAVKRTVEDLPLVPTTWTARKRSCGEPSTVSSRRMRSRPKRIPNSSSESRCSSARPRSQRAHESSSSSLLSLLQLVALGLDDGLGRLGDEALVGELALGARDLLAALLGALGGAALLGLQVDGVGREHRTLPPGTPTVATGSSPLVENSKRASRATCSATRS